MIAFSGMDGAGKTTQIELLNDYLYTNGSKVEVFWSRGGYTPGMLYAKRLFRVSANDIAKKSAGTERKKRRESSFSRPVVRKIWLMLSILDLFFYYVLYARIKRIFGVTMIFDRHIVDTEIDFSLNFPDEDFCNWWLWRFLQFCLVRPNKHFVATIPVDISMKRSRLKNEPFPDSKEVLEIRLSKYTEYLDKVPYAVHIDGLQSIEKIHSLVLNNLKSNT